MSARSARSDTADPKDALKTQDSNDTESHHPCLLLLSASHALSKKCTHAGVI